MLWVVPLTVAAEPEPEIETRVYWLEPVARSTEPFVPLPTPRRITPPALIFTVLASGYSPALSSTAPRKPFVSGASAETWLIAPWTFATLSPATGEMVTFTGTLGMGARPPL